MCSGVEAATVAWHSLSWEAEAFSEIEKFPSKVLAHHYPHVPNLGDMTKFEEWNIESIDLLVGGTPCQSFSVAGLRKGLSDPRGNLMLTFGAIANRFRPRWLVWENVPGVLSSNGGRDFGTFLGMLVELGYGWSYRVLDAQYFGVAQRRRRVFVVGYFGDFKRAAAVLFERHSLSGNPPPSRKKGKEVARCAGTGATFGGMSPVAGTITANTGGMTRPAGNANELDFCVPVFSMITANTGANGLGVSKEIAPTLDRAQPAAIAQPINIYGGNKRQDRPEGGFYVRMGENTSKTLDAASGLNPTCSQGGTAVLQPIAFNARQDPDSWEEHTGPLDIDGSTQAVSHSVVGPLFCHLGTINNQAIEAGHVVHDTIAIPISTQNALGRVNGIDEWPLGIFNDGDPAPTLSKSHGHAVGTNKSSDFAVRRLTPVECERLQGFPDNYTNIPNAADGPRYKALGNSMAVPVMHWIGKRIQQVEDIVNKNEVA